MARIPTPKLAKHLSRPPVGGLRFAVRRVGPGLDYAASAEDPTGKPYRIEATGGALRLTCPGGVESWHESIDEAETAAGRMNRERHPLRVPTFPWRKHSYREMRFRSKRWNLIEYQAVEACDVPFYGTGHFFAQGRQSTGVAIPAYGTTPAMPKGYTLKKATNEISFKPARGLGGEFGTACGIVDPYGAAGGHYLHARKADLPDLYKLLIGAANKGKKLYRVFPMVAGTDRHLPGALRQVSAWDAWLADARQSKHWREWKGGTYPEKYRGDFNFRHVGEALFLTQDILAQSKSGKLRYGKLSRDDQGRSGMGSVGSPARSIGRAAAMPAGDPRISNRGYWRSSVEYPVGLVDPHVRTPVASSRRTRTREEHAVGDYTLHHALVEIVEYGDGDEPYVKSLGHFRTLSAEEFDVMWHPQKMVRGKLVTRKLDVKVLPKTWLTPVEVEYDLPAAATMSQMELAI